ncbi:MAG: transcription factor S [Nitrososphaeraceae archaeon]|nr:transcription factor S [Nitrososphaeraceae archaeon]
MEFCPKCNTRMERRIEQNDIMVCPKCGYKEEYKNIDNNGEVATINSPQPPAQSKKTTFEVTGLSDANPAPLPTMDIECPKCGNNTASWWMAQTRSANESSTRFYRCTKCNHTWRNYD